MSEIPTTSPAGSILSVSPCREDHIFLQQLFTRPNWLLDCCDDLGSAVDHLSRRSVHLILCDGEFERGSWRELLHLSSVSPEPPFLIVASRLADEELWTEALNLGAYDVLAKPFYREELERVATSACQRWNDRHASAKTHRTARS